MSNLGVAMLYASLGIAIFPVSNDGKKRPLVKWSKSATADPEIVENWFRDVFPSALIGVPCKQNGFCVIDIDNKPGQPPGTENLIAWGNANGLLHLIERTPVTRTPSNGRHLLFRAPDGVALGNGGKWLPDGVDFRGNGGDGNSGGFVVAEGSTYYDVNGTAGLAYTAGEGGGFIDAIRNGTLPTLPFELVELARSSASDERPPGLTPISPDEEVTDDHLAFGAATLKSLAKNVRKAKPGDGNNALNRNAFMASHLIAYGWVESDDVYRAMHDAYMKRGGHDEDETHRSLRSAFFSAQRIASTKDWRAEFELWRNGRRIEELGLIVGTAPDEQGVDEAGTDLVDIIPPVPDVSYSGVEADIRAFKARTAAKIGEGELVLPNDPALKAIFYKIALLLSRNEITGVDETALTRLLLRTGVDGWTEKGAGKGMPVIQSMLKAAKADIASRTREAKAATPTIKGKPEIVVIRSSPMDWAKTYVANCHGHRTFDVRWNGKFYRWTGTHYAGVSDEAMASKAWAFLDECSCETIDEDGFPNGTVPFNPNTTAVSNFLGALRSLVGIPDTTTTPGWTQDNRDNLKVEDIVVVKNGLYHIPTKRLHPHTPRFFNHGTSDVVFDPNAPAPTRWLAFLEEALPGDKQAQDTLQEIIGYLISTDTSQQKIFYLTGRERSGKGTILRVISALVGRDNVASSTLLAIGDKHGLEPLIGKSVVVFPDASIGRNVDQKAGAEAIKSISGEDVVSINPKGMAMMSIKLNARLVFASNELIALSDVSGAFAKRIIMVEFNVSFSGREDTSLSSKLAEEYSGIFNWAMEGRERLTQRGYFVQPDSSKANLAEISNLGSTIRMFVEDRCKVAPGANIKTDDLYVAYQFWCGHNNLSPDARPWFTRKLLDAYRGQIHPWRPKYDDGKQYPSYKGITVEAAI